MAPQIPVHKDHSIAVVPFETDGDLNLYQPKGIVIGGPSFDAADLARAHRTELMTAIIDSGVHGVKVAEEADVVVSGRLDYSVNDDRDCREEQVEEHKKVRVCVFDRRVRLVVQVNARDKAGKIIETAGWTEKESEQTDRRKDLTDWETMLDVLASRAAGETARRLAPHCVLVRVQLQEGDSDAIEAANEQAKSGDWASAAKTWSTATDGSAANSQAAHFNLGVHHERKGRLKKALTHYSACAGSSACDSAKARAEARIESEPRFKAIGLAGFSCPR
jgi:hypothetical protein